MAQILGNVATNRAQRFVEWLVDQGIHEASYLFCFNDIVADFEKAKKDLVEERQHVQDRANQAKNQDENIPRDVKQWFRKADSLLEEDTETNVTCLFEWIPNCFWYQRRGKDLKRKTQEIEKLIGSKVLEKFSPPQELPEAVYHFPKDFFQFESRSSVHKQLLKELEDGDCYVIGLQGMGGAGKTTLAKEVGKQVKESKLFQHVIKVTVSNTPNIKNIQHEIASSLDLKLENKHELDRRKMLWEGLTNGEKILIILDDVWSWLNLEDIGIPSSGDGNNCRILLTTRDEQVCKSMGCGKNMIPLELLSEKDAWRFFQKCAGLHEGSPKTKRGQDIAKECRGLPVTIATIGSTLKGEEEKEWDRALKSLRSIDPNDEIINVYRRLKISYDYLKDEDKELFLLCAMFPEDYEIRLEDLTLYAIGLGLEDDSFENLRAHLNQSEEKLIDCCLLLEVDGRQHVKMHDLLRGLAHWMEKWKIKVIMTPGSNPNVLQERAVGKKYSLRYLYCEIINDLPNLLEYPKLEVLILEFGYGKFVIPETFFEEMKNLKVCTLEGPFLPGGMASLWEGHSFSAETASLPKSMKVLKSLKTLTLRNLTMDDISVLKMLQQLEALRLENCSIKEVPSEIVQLKKLKLLSLKDCEIEMNPSEVMEQIVPQLEELYFTVRPSLYGQVDNGVVPRFLNKISASPIQRYHIDLVGDLSPVNDSISRALSTVYDGAFSSSSTIKDLMKRAEILHLHKIEGGYKTIIPDFVKAIGAEQELIGISLEDCSGIAFLIDYTDGCSSVGINFSELVKLQLIRVDHLKALYVGLPPPNFLGNLQEMRIRSCSQLEGIVGNLCPNLKLSRLKILFVEYCPKLTSLFTLPVAQSLERLEFLGIVHCEAMKSIITDDSEKRGKEIVEHDHDQLKWFPKLETLYIHDCPQFKCVLSAG